MFDLENKKIFVWISIGIIALGIFLRSYNFSDWLAFNSDQARDATVVREMIEEKVFPSFGPVAGGTLFKLGPAFYYFQYAGASVFGAFPDKMAYADLLFGILAIPLLYLLARQYFQKNISLVLAALYATAFFTVQYSRFAWNPNSAQFFDMLFLYSILKLWDLRTKKKIGWLVLAGFSLGISMQLHTLLLFGMPLVSLALAIYLIKYKRIKFSGVILVIAIALLLNITQITSELRTGGANYLEFRKALTDKSVKQSPLWRNVLFVTACQAQANAKILVPYVDQEDCDFPLADKYVKRLERRMDGFSDWLIYAAKIIAVIIFSGGGYWLLRRKIKEGGEKKGAFVMLALFNLILLGVFAPFGAEISLRYFILTAFVPFLLLGLWLEFISERYGVKGRSWMYALICVLILYNLFFCFKIFRAHSQNVPGNMIDGTAKQAEEITDYIIKESGFAKKIQIGGQKIYLGRFYNRILYFATGNGVELVSLDENNPLDSNLPVLVAINEMSGECEIGKFYKYGHIESCKKMYDVAILRIKPGIE